MTNTKSQKYVVKVNIGKYGKLKHNNLLQAFIMYLALDYNEVQRCITEVHLPS